MRGRYDFLAKDPYYIPPLGVRASYCTSDRMSVYTSASKVCKLHFGVQLHIAHKCQSTTKTAVSEHRPLPKLPQEGYLKFDAMHQ